jgi:tetratricopeptide (TPR) repeat protein
MSTTAGRRRTGQWIVFSLGLLSAAGGGLWWWSTWKSVSAGVTAYGRGEWALASSLAERRLALAKDDPDALRLWARASARMGRHPMARAIYARLRPEDLAAEDHYLLGLGWSRAGQPDAAMNAWRSALGVDPDHVEALHELAQIGMLKAHAVEGGRAAERLARQPGWEVRGNLLLGMLRASDNDPAGAILALEEALRRDPTARLVPSERFSTRKLLARMFLRSGQSSKARETLRPVLDAGPDAEAWWLLSRAYLMEGNADAAESALARSGTYRADHPVEAEPAPYVGAARCVECHQDISRHVLASRHSKTYLRGPRLGDLPLPDRPLSDPGDPKVSHVIRRVEDRIELETHVPDRILRAVVDYALGSSERYLSLIGRDENGQRRVLRLSYYQSKEGSGWDRTKAQMAQPSHIEDYLGKPFNSADEVNECLICHTTVSRSAREQTGPEAADHAIGCEGCHGPGGLHLAAEAVRFTDPAIINPPRTDGAAYIKSCGHCHSQHHIEMPSAKTDPVWARFPSSTMPESRCYTESGGALSCVVCHDPHRNAETSPAHYGQKCLSCHATSAADRDKNRVANEGPFRSVCPVNSSGDCITCHMPKVPYTGLHTTFTDHYIRVQKRGAAHSQAGLSPVVSSPSQEGGGQ